MSRQKSSIIGAKKKIALVAHDNMKKSMIEWAKYNKAELQQHEIYATGTTGTLLEKELEIPVNKFLSGPLGGDQQIGASIAEGQINFLVFFWDPLEQQPHDPDVKALLRIAVLWNIPVASNRSSADFLFSSILMNEAYQRKIEDFEEYLHRKI
ncbi:MAG: methylglyoxal synthase [Cyclobacteriaceae bacterium]|nr:methylglyoxal synthase [Cyclobacteriaceae bacterium]